jgi:RNA recognition motif-containing protein
MGDANRSLHISGIDDGIGSNDLIAAFETYGKVRDVYIPRDFYTRKTRNCAFVEFETEADAQNAFDKIDYLTVNDAKLTVQWARGNRKCTPFLFPFFFLLFVAS